MAADQPLGYVTQTSAVSAAPPRVVYETISDLRNHLDWSGERASSQTFKLLSIEAPGGPAAVGTAFTSSGAADNGTFHDRSEVTVATDKLGPEEAADAVWAALAKRGLVATWEGTLVEEGLTSARRT